MQRGRLGDAPAGLRQGALPVPSSDAGSHFSVVGPISAAGSVVTAPGDPQVVVVESGRTIGTFDGGRTWQTVYRATTSGSVRVVGLTTAGQGVAIARHTRTSTLLMTRDGGRSWHPVAFSSTAAS